MLLPPVEVAWLTPATKSLAFVSGERTKRATSQNFSYCKEQVSPHSCFGYVCFRARRKGGRLEIKVVVEGQEDNLNLRITLLDSLRDFNPDSK